MDSAGLLANEAGLEEYLRATEALAANGDDVAIWQLIGLLFVRALGGSLHLRVKVQCNVAELLLDIAHNLAFRCCGEGVTTLSENLHEVLGEVAARKVQA